MTTATAPTTTVPPPDLAALKWARPVTADQIERLWDSHLHHHWRRCVRETHHHIAYKTEAPSTAGSQSIEIPFKTSPIAEYITVAIRTFAAVVSDPDPSFEVSVFNRESDEVHDAGYIITGLFGQGIFTPALTTVDPPGAAGRCLSVPAGKRCFLRITTTNLKVQQVSIIELASTPDERPEGAT